MQFFKLNDKQIRWLDLLYAMTEKEIKVRYKHSYLGLLWIAINPLMQMTVMGFIFQYFVPIKIDNYFLFLFTGLFPWNFFVQSFSRSTAAFFNERSLIKKATFPREIIVLSIVLSNLFHFLIALLLLIVIIFFYRLFFTGVDFFNFTQIVLPTIWLLPAIFFLVLFTTGLSLLTSSLNVRYRDIGFIVNLSTSLWFYITPIVYSLDILPTSLRPLFYLNPITFVIETFHYSLLGVPIEISSLIPVSIITIFLVFYLGIRVFKSENGNFDDWL